MSSSAFSMVLDTTKSPTPAGIALKNVSIRKVYLSSLKFSGKHHVFAILLQYKGGLGISGVHHAGKRLRLDRDSLYAAIPSVTSALSACSLPLLASVLAGTFEKEID